MLSMAAPPYLGWESQVVIYPGCCDCSDATFSLPAIFNVLGLPVTQCPLGLSSDGLPLGIQLVAASYNDHLTLAVARYLEKAFGGWVSPGKV